MEQISIFGFEKGMTVEQINSVSTKDAVQANEHTTQLLEVFPKQIELEGFDKYNIKLSDDSIIEQFRLLAYDVESGKLPEKLNQVFQKLSSKFGIYDSVVSDNISNLNYDSNELMEVLNKKNIGLNYVWGQDIIADYKNLIKKITLTVKSDNNNTGFICVEFLFNNPEENKPVDNTAELDTDLLGGDEEQTVYENEAAYSEEIEKMSDTSNKEEEPQIESTQEKHDSKINFEFTLFTEFKQNKFSLSIFNLFWYLTMIGLWCYLLINPLKTICIDKQSGWRINVIYYICYFLYTLFACCLPALIKRCISKFASTEEKERSALISGEQFKTNEHAIWKAYRSTFFKSDFGITNKTRANADLYFNYEAVTKAMKPNLPVINTFKIISASFMGLGILGTFIGFSVGLSNITHFSSSDTTALMGDIEKLVRSGLSTAFNTSIVGVFCSLIYNFFIYNPLILKLNNYFEELSDSLDQEFYVSETEALMQYTMMTDENANSIPFSQSLRFIIENMNKQTDALNNFNDNLADKIANMNESVNTALGQIATGVGTEVKEAVIANVHLELDGLKLSLTEAAKQLAMVAEKIAETPDLLSKANSELKLYLDDTRTSFTEMLDQNLEANKTALNEVVETIQNELTKNFAEFSKSITKALSSSQKAAELLDNIPGKIEQIETSFSEQEADVASRFENAAGKLQEVSSSVNEYLESVEKGITGILNDLTSAEENIKELLASAKMNEDNSGKNLTAVIEQTNTMLEGFKKVDVNLKNIFESIGNEIVKYNTTVDSTLRQYLSSFENGSTSFANSIHGSMQEFEDTLNELNTSLNDVQQTSKTFDDSITKLGKIMASKVPQNKQDN